MAPMKIEDELRIESIVNYELVQVHSLVLANDGLAICLADDYRKKLKNPYLTFDDLHQAARIGLCKAIKTYDKNKLSFSVYIYICMEREIKEEITKTRSTIRIPRKKRNDLIYESYSIEEDIIIDKKTIIGKEVFDLNLKNLDEQKLNIMYLRFYKNYTYKQIGKLYDRTYEWARQKCNEIIASLKRAN